MSDLASRLTAALADRYRLERELGGGGMSRVWVATEIALDRQVVVKVIASELTEGLSAERFAREVRLAARLQQANIVPVLNAGTADGLPYYTMPYVRGESLRARMASGSPLSPTERVTILRDVARALAYAHGEGIVHRDIKPENVLLESGGGLRLLDLGVVRLPMLEEVSGGEIPGTPSFMAPELFDGQQGDEMSDQYALGVTLYRMFCGRFPHGEIEPFSRPRFGRPAPLARYRPDLPAWLDHVLSRALSTDRNARFGDVLEMSMELETGMDRGVQVVLRQVPLYERNPLRFWQAVSALLAILLLVSLGLHVHR